MSFDCLSVSGVIEASEEGVASKNHSKAKVDKSRHQRLYIIHESAILRVNQKFVGRFKRESYCDISPQSQVHI